MVFSNNNALLFDEYLKCFCVYVPDNSNEIDGLLKFPVENDINELLSGICVFVGASANSKVEIMDVFRLNANDKAIVNKISPCSLVWITFIRTTLSDFVIMFGLRLFVRPYVRKRMYCTKCCEFDQTRKYCSKARRYLTSCEVG